MAEAAGAAPAVSERVGQFAASLEGHTPGLVTFEELAESLGDAGHAALILLLALPLLLPLPGVPLGFVFGLTIALLAGQIALGRTSLHLPARLAARGLPRGGMAKVLHRALPWLRRLEGLLRPGRLGHLALGRPRQVAGGVLVGLAVLLALPIPLGDPISACATGLIALGLMEHDGAAVLAGYGVAAAALAWNLFLLATGWHLLDMALSHLL